MSYIWHMSINRKPSTISRTTRGDVRRSNNDPPDRYGVTGDFLFRVINKELDAYA